MSVQDRLPQPQALDPLAAGERASATPARRSVAIERLHRPPLDAAVPTSLGGLERWMLEAITESGGADVDRVLTKGPRLSAAERLAVYQFGYYARLVECLRDDYPVMAAALGEHRFEELCHAYVRRHPSTSPNLNAFGQHMPDFARDEALLDAEERAFFSDLSRLEWALVEVIHASASAPLDAAVLATVPPEAWASACLERSDAVRLLTLTHPANAFYRAYRESGTLPERPAPEPSAVVVYRHGTRVWRMDLTPAMTRVLAALLEGEPIADALSRMGTDESDPEALAEAERSVMIWFREWISGGIFGGLRLP